MGTKVFPPTEFPPTERCPCGSRDKFEYCCEPKGVDDSALHDATVASLRAKGADPAFVYAYERTHLIITAAFREKNLLEAAADLDEWDDAVAEYRELHTAN
ncbi:MAG TPA: SEC-C domain-containing protein [Kofleriaceae bacterium]|jgi:uncharacterized protein YchJ